MKIDPQGELDVGDAELLDVRKGMIIEAALQRREIGRTAGSVRDISGAPWLSGAAAKAMRATIPLARARTRPAVVLRRDWLMR